jgi:putative transposase
VLNYLPKSLQAQSQERLAGDLDGGSPSQANKAFAAFLTMYAAKYPKATDCLVNDREALMTFYDFPAEHWVRLRISNVMELMFATTRLRTNQVKGAFSRTSLLSMLFKLAVCAE